MSWGAIPGPTDRELDVVGLGEISLDRVIERDAIPSPGGKQSARREHQAPGGQVATTLLACARLGLRTAFVGAVGDDAAAALALAPLESAGVGLSALQRIPGGATRRAIVLMEHPTGERSVLAQRDPRVRIESSLIDRELLAQARVLLVDGTDPEASIWAARAGRDAGAAVFLDADGASGDLEKLLPWIDFPVVSQCFAEGTGREVSVEAGLAALCRIGSRVAVATLGDRGALALDGDRMLESAAFEVTARDTTGAGDAFRAAWIAAALDGVGLEQALLEANAAAAMNCTGQGAQGMLANRETLAEFLRTHRQRGWRGPSGHG